MRMGVIPVGAAPIAHCEVIFITVTGANCVRWVAIHCRGRMDAVPVDDGWLWQFVLQRGLKAAATFHSENGILVSLARLFGLVQQKRRHLTSKNRETRGRSTNLQRASYIHHTERPAASRNEELLLEVFCPDRIEWVRACESLA